MPRYLRLHPDARPGSQARYAARFLMRTHFVTCLDEAPEDFKSFEVLTLQDLDSWFPDQARILSALPPAWTVQAMADLLKCPPLLLSGPHLSEASRGGTQVPVVAAKHLEQYEQQSRL